MLVDAIALSVDAIALSVDAIALLVDAIALLVDAIALSVKTIALLVDTIPLQKVGLKLHINTNTKPQERSFAKKQLSQYLNKPIF
ncbi:MAG: hypothetical protein RM368_23205 [Nostoc sp. DedSLP03]|uniref:hypothetical protein n=1 Tax=Nostoc sp. DedSLP03 TaxID=3075400 RepID=UPI002AD5423C|nr:hypothetical protein [Nostoc sp. DedSLP03]MDZ7967826.1 hypothetical protein [Nostoc sp. DedSLP03]